MRKRIKFERLTRKPTSVTQKYFESALRYNIDRGILKPGKKLVEYVKENGKIIINNNDAEHIKKYVTKDFYNLNIKIQNFTSYEQRELH